MVVHYTILAAVAVRIKDARALRGDLAEAATVARLTAADVVSAHPLQRNEGHMPDLGLLAMAQGCCLLRSPLTIGPVCIWIL